MSTAFNCGAVRHAFDSAPLQSSVVKSNVHCRGLFRKPSCSVSHLFITASVTIFAFSGEIAMPGLRASTIARADPAVCMWIWRFASAPAMMPS